MNHLEKTTNELANSINKIGRIQHWLRHFERTDKNITLNTLKKLLPEWNFLLFGYKSVACYPPKTDDNHFNTLNKLAKIDHVSKTFFVVTDLR